MRFVFSDSGRVWEPRMGFPVPRRPQFRWTMGGIAWLVGIALLVGLMLALAAGAHAQGVPLTNASVGIFDNIQEQYMQKALRWEAGLKNIALSLFGSLAVISIAWTFIKIVMQKNEATAFIPTMALQILTLGFFLYLVENGTSIARMILASFQKAGETVGGAGNITPSYVVINGFDCVFRVMEKIGEMDLSDSITVGLPLMICGILICLAFTGVAILLLVTMIESYFVLYGGIIMLGFGALPWTREIPKNYLIYAINVGVKIFVLSLVVSVGVEFSSDWPGMIKASTIDQVMHVTLYLLAGALVFVAVAWKVPGIAAALSSGSLNFNASDILGTTAAAAGAGAAAGGMAAAAGGSVMSNLAGATRGAMQATTAGMSLAAEHGASGMKAALKGLGHATGAAASEAGSALKAKAGFSPPSLNAEDGRGRKVENLGTRAANNLNQQAQDAREKAAASPTVAGGPAGGGPTVAPGGGGGDGGGGNAGGAGQTPAPAPVAPGNVSPALPGATESGPDYQDATDTGSNKGSSLKPPQLPPSDAGNGGVQINLSTSED